MATSCNRVLPAVLLAAAALQAQQPGAPLPQEANQPSSITVRSTLVLVPAMVKTAGGDRVFSLKASDFSVTDDGVEQKVQLEPDTDYQPLALAVVVQVGGAGAAHLGDYRDIAPFLDAAIGAVPHRIAVVDFDSQPELLLHFTPRTERAASAITGLVPGDDGAAILDALALAVKTLSEQPPTYRRAILLLSETVDHGSHTSLQAALRAISDTNTAIYSVSFGSTRGDLGHEAHKFNQSDPNPPGGCMAHDPDLAPGAQPSRAAQAWECASELAPPLRLARMAMLGGMNALKRNATRTVAQLTGGESLSFKDARSLQRALLSLSNDLPNRYILSFRPSAPHPGLHALKLAVVGRPNLRVNYRTAYWADAPGDIEATTPPPNALDDTAQHDPPPASPK